MNTINTLKNQPERFPMISGTLYKLESMGWNPIDLEETTKEVFENRNVMQGVEANQFEDYESFLEEVLFWVSERSIRHY